MENSNDNSINYDDLTEEEIKLIEKIHQLENSEELRFFQANLKIYAKSIGVKEVRDRIKQPKSALDKFREKGYKDADRMSDLVGIMAITDDMSLVYQVKDYIVSKLPKERTEEEDMIKNPKCGYRSYHVNSILNDFSDLENVNVPFEAQVKTEAMSIAQDTIHDSLYKKKDMPKEIRNKLSTILFPIIENMAQIHGFIDRSNPKDKEQLKQEIKQIKLDNIGVLRQYSDILKIVNQQYKNIILVKKQDQQIDFEEFLTENVKDELEYSTAEFHDQKSDQFFEDIESGKYNVPPPLLRKTIQLSESEVTATDIKTVVGTVNEKSKTPEQQVHISSQKQENEER